MNQKSLDNLVPFDSNQSHEQAKINGRKGGIASGESRREQATFAKVFRKLLDEKLPDGLTKREAIVAKALKRAFEQGDVRDVKVICDIMGESVTNVAVSAPAVVVGNEKEAEALKAIAEMATKQ